MTSEQSTESTRWHDLVVAGENAVVVQHGRDASKAVPIPRPSWADRTRDVVGTSIGTTAYRSEVVPVSATYTRGWSNPAGDVVTRASVDVDAKLYGNGHRAVGVTLASAGIGTPHPSIALTVDEARHLAHVLTAAADLAVTDTNPERDEVTR